MRLNRNFVTVAFIIPMVIAMAAWGSDLAVRLAERQAIGPKEMFALTMLALFAVSVVQNAAFTAVSRSRNSADVAYHARCSVASNGIWFVCQILIVSTLWKGIETGAWWQIGIAALVYVAATTIGSAWMMAHMLRTESGKRMVGAR